ncbi:hypothetical protein B0H14DRAFT_2625531 [Mycena olivaceomarginata]|nr:hypothetical protein B0H14DRAFT_2625531 [Mycena olivaceomarginata]
MLPEPLQDIQPNTASTRPSEGPGSKRFRIAYFKFPMPPEPLQGIQPNTASTRPSELYEVLKDKEKRNSSIELWQSRENASFEISAQTGTLVINLQLSPSWTGVSENLCSKFGVKMDASLFSTSRKWDKWILCNGSGSMRNLTYVILNRQSCSKLQAQSGENVNFEISLQTGALVINLQLSHTGLVFPWVIVLSKSNSDPRHFVTSLRSKKVRHHLGSILVKARHFCGRRQSLSLLPPSMLSSVSGDSQRRARPLWTTTHSRTTHAMQVAMHVVHATEKVKAARAAEDDLQAAKKAFADAQAHLELKRAESKGNSSGRVRAPPSPEESGDQIGTVSPTHTDAHGTTPSNTSTSASDVTVAEETMPDTFLIILPDTNDS